MRKSHLITVTAIASLLFVGWGCKSGNVPATNTNQPTPVVNTNDGGHEATSAKLGEDVTFSVGDKVTFEDGLTVTLVRINDSRCPKDVQCIWQGELGPELTISGGTAGTEPLDVRLGTVKTLQADAGGYNFSLREATATSMKIVVTKSAPAPLTDDRIKVDSPKPNQLVTSPLTTTGQAKGTWYFEASFPVKLLDANGKELAVTPAQAQGDWMTENFVPFKATLTFAAPTTDTGTLVLMRDNPSGLPQYEASVSIPVRFK